MIIMEFPTIPYFLNNNKFFLEFNTNILETNIVNIVLLIIIIYYGIKTTFNLTLEKRKFDIVQTLTLTQEDLLKSNNYYNVCITSVRKNRSLLEMGRISCNKEKLDLVLLKYSTAQQKYSEFFCCTDNLFKNFEKRAFLIMKRYIMLTVAGKILRKFLILSKEEKSQFLEKIVFRLGGSD
jgi:hypothetical protein